jgi:UV DNA damage endonuclease
MNIGYCCISEGINEGLKKKDLILVNRAMRKVTFLERGLPYVSELAIENLRDCLSVLKYNVRNGIYVYRMSSDMFPWFSNYELTDLPNFVTIKNLLEKIGMYIIENNMRCGFHPGPYTVIGSENPIVVQNSIMELNKQAQMLDLMLLPANNYYSINIHLNSTKPTLEEAAERFCNSFALLSDSCQKRLTVENDDKQAQYTVNDLYNLVHLKIGIPIIADSLHWYCHSGGISWEDTFKLAISTWGVKPLCHHSSSKKIYEDSTATSIRDHSDFLYEPFENFGIDVDLELECKMKDIALFKYKKDYICQK